MTSDIASPIIIDTEIVETLDEDNRLTRDYVDRVLDAVEDGNLNEVRRLVEPLHEADIADLLELTPSERRGELAISLGDLMSAEVLAEVNDYVREDIIDALPAAQVAGLAGQLDSDDAVAIIEDMEAEDQQAVLAELDPEDRAVIEDALSYPDESAGRIMQRELVAVPEHMTVGQLIDYLRDHQDLTTEFWEVFVVDPQHKPVGTCKLSWIMRSERKVPVSDIMMHEQTLIPVDMDQEEVALRFQKYALISAAVVDASGRLVGVITADDIVHIIQEEADEDILRLSGAGDGDINEPIADSYKARVRWLIANLGTALVASSVISFFGAAIEHMVALAVLMPIVAGVGGNAGTQTLAVTVRAIATNQLTDSNTRRAIKREMAIAFMNGATIAALAGIGVTLWFQNFHLGFVIAAAMQCNILLAGFAGVFIPVMLDRFDQDPAVASSVFVTMITDSMGFLIFLSLAVFSGLVG
ncbi:MgtE Mg/Co/Ni transporter MgtE (contains CBS domain) [Sphingomonadaceae bacterium]|jgi:magnesium transporter|uniref:magnesium transporter n=1 Tax=Sphingorhabdus sp. TaxID=1902408 RepID=UPI00273F8206|nr:magnesium transporter [Sphingorhabdus sp.]MCF8492376.1 magnesium transporter [Sphingomonadaceae bacterium]MCF8498093.1 magnesium transporter [Sphingomonadaceae bacterium]MDP4872917.1 magnesium transporter [Sphingorhabdus sp.]MDP4928001.1 magnesium transporter [Sphingorhabdus sp.]